MVAATGDDDKLKMLIMKMHSPNVTASDPAAHTNVCRSLVATSSFQQGH